MKANYYHERLGITFKIIGLLFEDDRYEVYHARNKKYDRDLILHFQKKEGGRKFNVPMVNFEKATTGSSGSKAKEINLPWDNKSEKPSGH